MQCIECNRTEDETTLHKCAICFKSFCEEHSYQVTGRMFCSRHCAEYFFFGDADEDEDVEVGEGEGED